MKDQVIQNQNKPPYRKNQVAVDIGQVDLNNSPKRFSSNKKGDSAVKNGIAGMQSDSKNENSNKSNTIESDPNSNKIQKQMTGEEEKAGADAPENDVDLELDETKTKQE